MPESWYIWNDGAREPALNMAVDEALLEMAAATGRPVLRCYGWDRPAVTIGYIQTFAAAPAAGYTVIRRPTGGGVVFHDADFTYTVVIPPEHALAGASRLDSYAAINRAVAEGLRRLRIAAELARQEIPGHVNRSRMVCFDNPTRYDLLLDERKIAGSAQRRTRHGILHQGSIVLGPAAAGLSRDRITAVLLDGFAAAIPASFTPFAPTAELEALASRLTETRYATPAWNQLR